MRRLLALGLADCRGETGAVAVAALGASAEAVAERDRGLGCVGAATDGLGWEVRRVKAFVPTAALASTTPEAAALLWLALWAAADVATAAAADVAVTVVAADAFAC